MCMAVTCFAVISIHSLPKEGDSAAHNFETIL